MQQLLKMKGERGWWHAQMSGDRAGGEAFRSALDQEAEDGEPMLVRKRSERTNSLIGVHFHLLSFHDCRNIRILVGRVNDVSGKIELYRPFFSVGYARWRLLARGLPSSALVVLRRATEARAGWHSSGRPPQQSSVKKPINSFMPAMLIE